VTTMDAVTLGGIVVLLAAAGWLSAVETVLLRLDLVRALAIDDNEDRGAGDLVWILEHAGTCQNVTLFLTVSIRVATAALATVLAARWWPGAPGVVAAALIVVVLSLVFAEIAPRSAAMRHLDRTGLRVAPAMRRIVAAVHPVSRLFVRVGRAIAGARPETSGPFPSDEPLAEPPNADVDADAELEEDERAMIRSIFELGDTIAREIMVPRPDMVMVAETAPLRELVNTVIEHGYSRIPVYRDDREQIVGVVYAKDVLHRIALQPDRAVWQDLLRPATFIPETKRIDDLLRDLRDQSVHIAFVVDEYGATTGLVTIEDILEEIVGEIVDEHDHEAPLVEVLDDERLRIDARLPVDELNALIGVSLPDTDWDTVGGLVVGAFGHVPSPGESVDLEGVRFTAEQVQGRRVAKVVVTRQPVATPEEPSR
jgi:CBS domain containing-hemolysin-like protein